MAVKLQLRRDTTANWSASNPILAEGEIGIDTTLRQAKIGDGVTAWNSLVFGFTTTAAAGLPAGGAAGLFLRKRTGTDYDAEWVGGAEALTAARTYYVRTDGSDSNTGLVNNAGGAFLTIQKAVNVVAGLFIGSNNVTIQIADGTYTGNVTVNAPWSGTGTVTLLGNTGTPANVVLNPADNGTPITVTRGGRLTISGMQLHSGANGHSLVAQYNGVASIGTAVRFGSATNFQIFAVSGGTILANVGYTVSGGASAHASAEGAGSTVFIAGVTVTLSGTPAFSSYFAGVNLCGVLSAYSMTFSGSATGVRYLADRNGVIWTNGAGATYFPGNAAGSEANGGLYR